MEFAAGDRVVVTEKYRGAGCNHGARGFYGHVVAIEPSGDSYGPWIRVAFRGHIDGPSAIGYDHYIGHGDEHPFPLYSFELEHD